MSKTTVHLAGHDPTLDAEIVEECQKRIGGRMAVAADSFLSQSLSRIKELGPYQAMLCSGIAFDKHLQGRLAASHGGGGTVLVQILTLIDQSARAGTPDSDSSRVLLEK